MKSACHVFMVVGFAALLQGTSFATLSGTATQQGSSAKSADTASDRPRAQHAAPDDGGKHQAGGKRSDEQSGDGGAPLKHHPPSQASLPKANRPNQAPNHREHSTSGNAMNLHEPGSDKSGGAAKAGFIQNEIGNSALPVRSPSVISPTVPPLDNVRHRAPNPAVIGGLANPKTKDTGTINGTRMNRKP